MKHRKPIVIRFLSILPTHLSAPYSGGILLRSKGMGENTAPPLLSQLKRVLPKRLDKTYLCSCNGIVVLLLTICMGLFAGSTSSSNPLDAAAYYQKLKEKEEARIQRALDLQMLVTGLIAFTEGSGEKALTDLEAAGQSEYVKKLVDSQLEAGMDGLIQRCRQGIARPEIRICPTCSGAGIDVCEKCRGVGKTRDDSICLLCRGLGATSCRQCSGRGTLGDSSNGAGKAVDDPALEALILKALYLKNGGADLFE